MNRKEWSVRLEKLQTEQNEASRRETHRQISNMDPEGGSSYPGREQARRNRSRLTFDDLLNELKGLKLRLNELNNLGPRPGASDWVERLTDLSQQVFGRSKDPRETLGKEIQSFSSKLANEAQQEGLDFAEASIEADCSEQRCTDLQHDLRNLDKDVRELQKPAQDADLRIEAIYRCLREQQRLEQEFGKFDAEQREGTIKFTLFPKPSRAQLLEIEQKIGSLREQLNPVRESQETLLGLYHKQMAKVQAMPKGPDRDLSIAMLYNLALEEKLEPSKPSPSGVVTLNGASTEDRATDSVSPMEFASVRTSVSSVAGPLVQFTSEGQQPSVSEPGGNHSRRVSGTASLMPEMPEGEPLGEALSRQSTRSQDPPVSSPESNGLSTDTDRYPVESGE